MLKEPSMNVGNYKISKWKKEEGSSWYKLFIPHGDDKRYLKLKIYGLNTKFYISFVDFPGSKLSTIYKDYRLLSGHKTVFDTLEEAQSTVDKFLNRLSKLMIFM